MSHSEDVCLTSLYVINSSPQARLGTEMKIPAVPNSGTNCATCNCGTLILVQDPFPSVSKSPTL